MKIIIKSTNLDVTPALREYIEEKVGSVAKFLKRWDEGDVLELRVEVARSTKHHHKGDVFYAEATLGLPHAVLRAEHEGSDIRASIDIVKDTLHREVEKYKEKQTENRR